MDGCDVGRKVGYLLGKWDGHRVGILVGTLVVGKVGTLEEIIEGRELEGNIDDGNIEGILLEGFWLYIAEVGMAVGVRMVIVIDT